MPLPTGIFQASKRPGLTAVALSLALLAPVSQAFAQSTSPVESFYKGRQIRMIIASGPGGGYDAYGRAVARHIGRYIPGNPTLVAQNMDGAGGLIAMNYTYNIAEKDGTAMLATYNSLILQPLLDPQGVRFDPRTFSWIGSVSSQQNVCLTWATNAATTLADATQKEIVVAASGASSDTATTPKILNALAGTKFKVVMGYDTNGSRLAVERGEVDGVCGLSWSTLKASSPDWLEQKKVHLLTQMGLRKHPEMPDVPLVLDFVKDDFDKQVLALLLSRSSMGRPFVAPPNVPAERLAVLRAAFMSTMKDPEFLSDAEKMKLEVDPMSPEDMVRLIQAAYDSPKEVLEKAGSLVAHTK